MERIAITQSKQSFMEDIRELILSFERAERLQLSSLSNAHLPVEILPHLRALASKRGASLHERFIALKTFFENKCETLQSELNYALKHGWEQVFAGSEKQLAKSQESLKLICHKLEQMTEWLSRHNNVPIPSPSLQDLTRDENATAPHFETNSNSISFPIAICHCPSCALDSTSLSSSFAEGDDLIPLHTTD